MKDLRIRFLFYVLFFSLTACKDDFYTMKGKVVDAGNGLPIENVRLVLHGGISRRTPFLKDVVDDNYSGNNDTAYTNEKGEFELQVREDSRLASLQIDKKEYFEFQEISENTILGYAECGFNPVLIKKGENKSTDTLLVYFQTKYWRTDEKVVPFNSNYSFKFVGESPFKPDTRFSVNCYGNSYVYYKFVSIDKTGRKELIDSVFIKSFETVTDTLYY